MQKKFKIFLLISFIPVFFSCEQRFFYLKKVNVNSSTTQIKKHEKNIHSSSTSDFKAVFNSKDSTQIISENYTDKIDDDFLTADIDTPKPYIIKKLSVVEEENLNAKNKNELIVEQKPADQKISTNAIIGLLFMVLGIIGFVVSNSLINNSGNCDSTFRGLIIGFLAIILLIIGIVFLIIGLIQS